MMRTEPKILIVSPQVRESLGTRLLNLWMRRRNFHAAALPTLVRAGLLKSRGRRHAPAPVSLKDPLVDECCVSDDGTVDGPACYSPCGLSFTDAAAF